MIHSNQLQRVHIDFQTLLAPPPYSQQYWFMLELQADQLQVRYELHYLDRDTLTEEEILEEGFTLDDDYRWQGTLPDVWTAALQEMLHKTHKLKSGLAKDQPNLVRLKIIRTDDTQQEGVPDNLEGWEYFLQEMTQAVFELGQKEQSLVVRYREVSDDRQPREVHLKPVFSRRSFEASVQQAGKTSTKTVGWQELKPLLSAIYLPDYDATHASAVPPTHPGQYIDPGEGLWYNLHQDLSNPGKQYDAIGAMEKLLRQWL